ncbi:YppG family protein [Virgibacillus doumboii]|uniref:YppG family protein n=1 Tax=Virgibacillus doumboii TaxID=2697503 RepID=UPI0013E02E45|nr:YppG family protein [Virgibacillus doumboii]
MFERPYYYSPPYADNAYYYQQNANHPGYNAVSPNHTAHFQTPFEMYSKPKLPVNWNPYFQSGGAVNSSPAPNNLLHYFQDNNGEMDLDKVLTTVGQLANTFQQISPVVKDVGSMMKKL